MPPDPKSKQSRAESRSMKLLLKNIFFLIILTKLSRRLFDCNTCNDATTFSTTTINIATVTLSINDTQYEYWVSLCCIFSFFMMNFFMLNAIRLNVISLSVITPVQAQPNPIIILSLTLSLLIVALNYYI